MDSKVTPDAEEKLKHITLKELIEMINKGEVFKTGPNASEIDIPKKTWNKMEPLIKENNYD
jgi:hypothetical protein